MQLLVLKVLLVLKELLVVMEVKVLRVAKELRVARVFKALMDLLVLVNGMQLFLVMLLNLLLTQTSLKRLLADLVGMVDSIPNKDLSSVHM